MVRSIFSMFRISIRVIPTVIRPSDCTELTYSRVFFSQNRYHNHPVFIVLDNGFKCVFLSLVDLFLFYTKVQMLGGYDSVSAGRLWKTIYDDIGGNTGSTSAATITRRHYER